MRRLMGVAGVLLVLAGIAVVLFLTARPTSRVAGDPPVAASGIAPASAPGQVAAPVQPAPPDRREESAAVTSAARVLEQARAREAQYAAKDATQRKTKQHLCPAYALPAFPWPDAPQPTSSAQIASSYLSAPGERAATTLGEAQSRLVRAARNAGYRIPSVLGAGCNGFAMVLDLERLRDDGRRVPGVDGFAGPGQRKYFSVLDILADLIKAEPGYFRVIVVVVSDEARARSEARISADALRGLAEEGKAALPAPLAALPFDERYVVDALVYEFEKPPKSEGAELRKPEGRLAATTHLAQARLIELAGPAR